MTEDKEAQARQEAARQMGRARSEKKAAAARANGSKSDGPHNPNGGRKIKPMGEIACTCGAGDVTVDADGKPLHRAGCPQGRVIRYRLRKGLPLT